MGWDRPYARAWGAAAATLAAGLLAAGLASAPTTTSAAPTSQTYDTGWSSTSVTVAPVYKRVPIRRCLSFRYNATTRVTTCLRYRAGMANVRFLGAVVQQKNASGVWVRIPYSWSRRYGALVYNRWLALQLAKPPVVAPRDPAPSGSPTSTPATSPPASTTPPASTPPASTSPPASTTSPPASPTDTATPVITASILPLPAGTGLSPTPTSTLVGEGAAKSTQYSFLSGAATPATAPRWDKCLPVTWTVDLANASKAGTTAADELARWQSAVDVASRVTGFTFQYVPGGTGKATIDQTTNKVVDSAWTSTGAKVVITYVSPTDAGAYRSTAVNGSTIGNTAVSWMSYATDYQLFSKGSVQLEYDWLATASETDRYNLILHEFGHALGLGHVADTSQVMNPAISHQDLFRLGDRTGLWQLAQQPCR